AVAKKYTYLGEMVPSPALISERIQMYMAEDITFTERELDEDEFLDVQYVTLDRLYEMVMSGEIKDAKTQIAVLKAYQLKTKCE
ncbi:MAG: NUDIX hydrolase, partial [Clostridia bacterium]|nr:NUDIX hydrolase [Clostridia bacterium]